MKEIVIDGTKYPCRVTMGAYVRFERETGKDVREAVTMTDLITFFWACVASACAADGIKFEYDLTNFADALTVEDLNAFNAAQAAEAEKKSEATAAVKK